MSPTQTSRAVVPPDLSHVQLNTLSPRSNISNGVSTLDNPYADPETEELSQKPNDLINALRR